MMNSGFKKTIAAIAVAFTISAAAGCTVMAGMFGTGTGSDVTKTTVAVAEESKVSIPTEIWSSPAARWISRRRVLSTMTELARKPAAR